MTHSPSSTPELQLALQRFLWERTCVHETGWRKLFRQHLACEREWETACWGSASEMISREMDVGKPFGTTGGEGMDTCAAAVALLVLPA